MPRLLFCVLALAICIGCNRSDDPETTSVADTRTPSVPATTDAPTMAADPEETIESLAFDPSDLELPVTEQPTDTAAATATSTDGPNADPSPMDLAETLRAAEAAQRDDDFETAAQLAREALAIVPQRADVRRSVAEILIRSQQMDEGINLLEGLHNEAPESDKIALMLVSAYRRKMREASALDDKSQAIRRAANLILELSKDGRLVSYGQKGEVLLISVLIEAAQTSAADGKADDAIAALRGLIGTGKVRVSDLAKEPVFDALRATSEFQQVLSEYEASGRQRMMVGAQQAIAETKPYRLDFSLLDYQGRRVTSKDFPDKIMLVDFWGTWCGPCRMQSPHLARLQRKYADQLAVVGIAYEKVPRSKWARNVEQYVKEHDLPYPCLLGDDKTKSRVRDFTAFPTLVFLDRRGVVRLQLRGLFDYDRLDAVVNVLMSEDADT